MFASTRSARVARSYSPMRVMSISATSTPKLHASPSPSTRPSRRAQTSSPNFSPLSPPKNKMSFIISSHVSTRSTSTSTLPVSRSTRSICLDAPPNSPATIHFLDLAAKLDQTVDSICAPKCAITRDPSVYTERGAAVPSGGSSSTTARR
ncbi:citrate synthase [Ceratobasidium sp. UAMH 11750]|nr:citrate synthase [Ceratobasidium sp. UAMH 11750]